jgi:hypothetical protein
MLARGIREFKTARCAGKYHIHCNMLSDEYCVLRGDKVIFMDTGLTFMIHQVGAGVFYLLNERHLWMILLSSKT